MLILSLPYAVRSRIVYSGDKSAARFWGILVILLSLHILLCCVIVNFNLNCQIGRPSEMVRHNCVGRHFETVHVTSKFRIVK